VEWLGNVPSIWSNSKIKHIVKFQVGWTPPTKTDANFEGMNLWANISDLKNRYVKETVKKISDAAAAAASMEITPKGSLLYSFKLSVGSVSFAAKDMYTNEAIASFLDGGTLPLSYLYYALPIFVIQNASTNIYGARILNQELINNAHILAPTHNEAVAIAAFLDHETAKIDNLIEKQQKLIALLKEKRQVVISHAVTKGLNPDVPMKDSGVEWLGDVPAHWKVLPVKREFDVRLGKMLRTTPSSTDDELLPYLRAANIQSSGVDTSDVKKMWFSPAEKEQLLLKSGDLLVSEGGDIGRSAIWCNELTACYYQNSINRVRSAKENLTKFLYYWMVSIKSKGYIDFLCNKLTIAHFTAEKLQAVIFLCPSISEQKAIVNFLDHETTQIDNLINKTQHSIDLSKERRTALISAAVTGKIDVRNWQPPPPHKETI
jgi:type I restriction enzyme S subunit